MLIVRCPITANLNELVRALLAGSSGSYGVE